MMPRCPHCQSFAFLDWTACGSCGVELGYRYTTLSFLQVHPEGTVADGDTSVAYHIGFDREASAGLPLFIEATGLTPEDLRRILAEQQKTPKKK